MVGRVNDLLERERRGVQSEEKLRMDVVVHGRTEIALCSRHFE